MSLKLVSTFYHTVIFHDGIVMVDPVESAIRSFKFRVIFRVCTGSGVSIYWVNNTPRLMGPATFIREKKTTPGPMASALIHIYEFYRRHCSEC